MIFLVPCPRDLPSSVAPTKPVGPLNLLPLTDEPHDIWVVKFLHADSFTQEILQLRPCTDGNLGERGRVVRGNGLEGKQGKVFPLFLLSYIIIIIFFFTKHDC